MARVRSVFASSAPRAVVTRRRSLSLFFLLFALILAVVNLANWRMYAGMRATLDAELGERLKAIASAAAQPVDPGYIEEIQHDPGSALGAFVVLDQFERFRDDLNVTNLLLLDREGRCLVDLGGTVPPLVTHPLSALHADAFAAARGGITATSALYASLGERYKNGYAPVRDLNGAVVGVVGVEAGAGFFDGLRRVGRTVLVANAASAVAILLLGAIFYRLLRAQARLDEALRRTETLSLMGEMAASVAHEIKNPLGIIRATAERIRRRHGTGEEIFDYIPEEVDRLDAILGTYLDFARRGGAAVAEGHCDVSQVVASVLRLVGRDLVAAGIRVNEAIEGPLPAALPATSLQQVLLNLVLNARRAMPDGGAISISGRRAGRMVRVDVKDTGVGIAPDDIEKVFHPFYSGEDGGSGLGLAIVQRVIAESRGRIEVESERGEGTVFTLWIPAAD